MSGEVALAVNAKVSTWATQAFSLQRARNKINVLLDDRTRIPFWPSLLHDRPCNCTMVVPGPQRLEMAQRRELGSSIDLEQLY